MKRVLAVGLLLIGIGVLCVFIIFHDERRETTQSLSLPEEVGWHVRNSSPRNGFAFVTGIDRPAAWGTTKIQTPTPFTNGTEHVHFADVGRAWSTAVRAPTLKNAPTRLSTDGSLLASYGVLCERPQDLSSPLSSWLQVIQVCDGKVIWAREIKGGVTGIRWLRDSTVFYSTWSLGAGIGDPSEHSIYQLNPLTGKETKLYTAAKGCAISEILPSASGHNLLICEEGPPGQASSTFVLNMGSRRKTLLKTKGGYFRPGHFAWWPNEQSVYAENAGEGGVGPVRVNISDPAKILAFADTFTFLEPAAEGSLSGSGNRLLISIPSLKKLCILDLQKNTTLEVVAFSSSIISCALDEVSWSGDEQLVGGWIFEAGEWGARWSPFVLDVEGRKMSFFRSSKDSAPFFFVENPKTLAALRARGRPWK